MILTLFSIPKLPARFSKPCRYLNNQLFIPNTKLYLQGSKETLQDK